MENVMNELSRNGHSLTTDPSLRLPSRSLHGAFEDHGQSLLSPSRKGLRSQASNIGNSKRPSATSRSINNAKTLGQCDSESEDEMDLFSSHKDADEGRKVSDSQDTASVLSKLKFKKNKVDKDVVGGATLSQPVSRLPAAPPSPNWSTPALSSKKIGPSTFDKDTIYARSRPLRSLDGRQKSENTGSFQSTFKPPQENLPTNPEAVPKIGPPRRNVRPKRVYNLAGAKPKLNESECLKGQSLPFSAAFDDDFKDQDSDIRSAGMSHSRSRARASSPAITVRKPEAFPLLSPAPSPSLPKHLLENFPRLSPLRDRKPRAGSSPRRAKRRANPFPNLSPPKGEDAADLKMRTHIQRKMQENRGVLITELNDDDEASPTKMVYKGKGKGKELYPPDGPKEKARKKPKTFPMSSQMLQSINSSPPSVSPRRGKRSSPCSADERISKKSKRENDAFLLSLSRSFEEEGDSLLFSPEVDPGCLCPYCDTVLPEEPSSVLLDLIAATRKKAIPDPRPSNPLGLKAPVVAFVTVCQRHRFESQILPEAEIKKWPKRIEWDRLADRVIKMRQKLQSLIEDQSYDSEKDVLFSSKPSKLKGPKASNIFWNDVIKEIRVKGSNAVASVRGQFENFEKAQPGYYGEQGSVIIYQTLYDMFPPSSIDASLIAPLTGIEFMEKILVPEVALRLIMEDRDLRGEGGRQEALTVLRESSSYGVFMFPEDGGEWDGRRKKGDNIQLGVGDMIVMQRAMKRRKELEEECEVENESERAANRDQEEATEDMTTVRIKERARTLPKPRPLGKVASYTRPDSPPDKPTKPNYQSKQKRSKNRNESLDSGTETAVDSDLGQQVDDGHSSPCGLPQSSQRSTSRAISGLNIASDTEAGAKSVVGPRPFTRSRSRSVIKKEIDILPKTDGTQVIEDIFKTPMRVRPKVNLDDSTPKAPPRSLQTTGKTPPLLKARRRNQDSAVALFRVQNPGSSKTPLPSRIQNKAVSQDSRWLLDDDSS